MSIPCKLIEQQTMSTAVTTRIAMSGIKRKSAPVKEVHNNGNKKAKVELGLKSFMKDRDKSEKDTTVEASSAFNQISEESDSEGGALLYHTSSEGGEAEEDDGDRNARTIFKAADEIPPDRAKAVAINSEAQVPPKSSF